MPNHVYSIISVEEKYIDKLEEISKVGLCRYYMPMPLELEKSSSPCKIITAAQHKKGERGMDMIIGMIGLIIIGEQNGGATKENMMTVYTDTQQHGDQ